MAPHINVGASAGASASASSGSSATLNQTQEISPQTASESTVNIDDHSVNKYYNRQFPSTIQPTAPSQVQYFGPWSTQQYPWNYFPIQTGEYTQCQVKKLLKEVYGFLSSKVDEKVIKILYPLAPRDKVMVVNTEPSSNDGVWLIGFGAVRMESSGITYEALAVLLESAMENGANLVVVKTVAWQDKAESKGWHIGFGTGASGLIGSDEKVGIQGAGGTGIGKSSVTRESMPWIQAIFYRDGNLKMVPAEIKDLPSKEKQEEISIKKISPVL
jgi:hypothetical protein